MKLNKSLLGFAFSISLISILFYLGMLYAVQPTRALEKNRTALSTPTPLDGVTKKRFLDAQRLLKGQTHDFSFSSPSVNSTKVSSQKKKNNAKKRRGVLRRAKRKKIGAILAHSRLKQRRSSVKKKKNNKGLTNNTVTKSEKVRAPILGASNAIVKPVKAHATWKRLQREALFQWPVSPQKFWISSLFGPRKLGGRVGFHAGIDMASPRGTPVIAAGKGVIAEATYNKGYGNYIVIAHGNGFKTRYAHLDKILVKVGKKVNVGDNIGRVGATGFVRKSRWGSSGAHLHFEVYKNGKPVNPFYFLA
jgi:murein DD-endopeptidase MepM/ murein hydrolase activator NlpD